MKRNKTGKKITIGILLILTTIGLGTLARYYSSVEGSGSATAAYYVSDAPEFTIDELPTQPGEKTTTSFTITNTKNEKTAETKLQYTLEFITANNIPLQFTTTKGQDTEKLNPNTQSKVYVMGLGSQTDQYTVAIEWPADENDAKYAGLVDYVKVKLHVEQVAQ